MKRDPGVRRDEKRGTWMYALDVPGVDGKRRQELRRGFRTVEQANAAIRARRSEVAAGLVAVPSDDTVAGFAAGWIAALPAEGLEGATIKHYRECLQRLTPTIGRIKLQDLTGQDLDRAYAVLQDAGRSARTIRASHVAAKKMIAEAVRLRVVVRNVADEARPPRARAAAPKTFPTWTRAQLDHFLGAAAEDPHVAMWTVASDTGLRVGEIVALRWEDVDLDREELVVSQSVGRTAHGTPQVKKPKTASSARTVELDGPLIAVLRAHRKAQAERRLLLGAGYRDHDLVFAEVDGSPTHPNVASKRWAALVRRVAPTIEVPVIRLHDLRHSHCTHLLDAGVRPDVVTERLGHSSVAFTLQRYGHRYAGDQRSGLARLRADAR